MEAERGEKQIYNSKDYSCKICGKLFPFKSFLSRHERIHYTGEKPYECEIRKKTFSQISALTLHQKIHTDVKLYECEFVKSLSVKIIP